MQEGYCRRGLVLREEKAAFIRVLAQQDERVASLGFARGTMCR